MAVREISTLAALRRKANMSQEELALAVGRSQPEISQWENGAKISEKMRVRLHDALRARVTFNFEITPEDLGRPWEETLLRLARF